MANPEHVKWLLEGVESWNERRNRDGFIPDLSRSNLYEEFRKAGKLDHRGRFLLHDDLRDGVNLEGANLESVVLTNGDLWGANLSGAYLRFAELNDTDLWGANLKAANFSVATLYKSSLRDADLTDADFTHAHLLNLNLAAAKPWTAKLFRSGGRTPEQYPDEENEIDSTEALLRGIRNLNDLDASCKLYFRGEARCGWELRPSVMRDGFAPYESEMLVDLVSRRPEEFNGTTSALAQWVLAQHHGLRTRFLDITKNPLVALYHACANTGDRADSRLHVFSLPKELIKTFNSDTISIVANFARLSRHQQEAILGRQDCSCHSPGYRFHPSDHLTSMRVLYQLIRAEKPYFDEQIDPRDLYRVFVVEPQQSSERIRAQSGAFLVSAFHDRLERDEVLKLNNGTPIYAHYHMTIPHKRKPDFMNDLRLLNVTQETIYPGLDSSAKAVTSSHMPE